MDKTTRELLEAIKEGEENPCGLCAIDLHDGSPLEPAIEAWRDAGYPDLDQPEALPEGTCWTCANDNGTICLFLADNICSPEREAVDEWCDEAIADDQIAPPRDYTGPPCPGCEPSHPTVTQPDPWPDDTTPTRAAPWLEGQGR